MGRCCDQVLSNVLLVIGKVAGYASIAYTGLSNGSSPRHVALSDSSAKCRLCSAKTLALRCALFLCVCSLVLTIPKETNTIDIHYRYKAGYYVASPLARKSSPCIPSSRITCFSKIIDLLALKSQPEAVAETGRMQTPIPSPRDRHVQADSEQGGAPAQSQELRPTAPQPY